MLQAGIKTRLTLRHPDNIISQPPAEPMQAREFNVYVLTSFCLYFTLSETGVLNSLVELCITRVATVNSLANVLNLRGGGGIYIYIYIYIHL